MKFKKGDLLIYKGKLSNRRESDFEVIDIKSNKYYILICRKTHKTLVPLAVAVDNLLELVEKRANHPLTHIFK